MTNAESTHPYQPDEVVVPQILHVLKRVPPAGPPLPNLVEIYLEAKAVTLMASTITHYRYHLERFLDWLGERDLTGPTINAFLLELKEAGRADWYRRSYHRTIKTWIYWLLDEEYITHDPFRGRGRVQPVKLRRKVRLTYSDEDILRLLSCRKRPTWKHDKKGTRWQATPGGPLEREALQGRTLVACLIDSALRASEVCRLNCGDIRARELVIISKGGHQDMAFLSQATRHLLLELAGDRPDDAPLFRNKAGNRCDPGSLGNIITRLARRAGVALPPRHLHAFRHYAAQVWTRAKLPDVVIMKLMRHTSVETTRIYTQLGDEDLARLHAAASPVDRLLALADLRGRPDALAEGGQ